LFFKPAGLKEKKTKGFFGTLETLRTSSILQKKSNDSNPLRLPGERLRDKGRRSTITMIFSTVSSKMHIDFYGAAILPFAKFLLNSWQQKALYPCKQQKSFFC
jgi:hypothetical protein